MSQPSLAKQRRVAKQQPRAPLDWYVEPSWAVEALFDAIMVLGSVGDPACGMGTIPEVARRRGHNIVAADIRDRGYTAMTTVANFLEDASPFEGVDNIIMNPPYGYRPGIAEAFVRRALALKPAMVAALVPVNWLSGQARYDFFNSHPPARILHFMERPSMPPGHRLAELGARAFKGGRINYCWIVWERDWHLTEIGTVGFIPPREKVRS